MVTLCMLLHFTPFTLENTHLFVLVLYIMFANMKHGPLLHYPILSYPILSPDPTLPYAALPQFGQGLHLVQP